MCEERVSATPYEATDVQLRTSMKGFRIWSEPWLDTWILPVEL